MSKRLLSEKTSLWVKFTSRDVKSLIRFHSFVHFKDTSLWMHIYKWGKILFDPHQQISKRGSAFQPWKVPEKSSSKTQSSRAQQLTFCWVVKVEFIKLSTQCFLFHALFIGKYLTPSECWMYSIALLHMPYMAIQFGSLTKSLKFLNSGRQPFHHLTSMSSILTEASKSLWYPFLPP